MVVAERESLSTWQGLPIIRDVDGALAALQHDTMIACDLETSGLSPFRDKIAVISLYGYDTDAMAVLHVRGSVPRRLVKFLSEPGRMYTFHNGPAFDIPFLMQAGVDFDRVRLYDTLVGETVLVTNGRRNTSVSLRATVERRLNITLEKNADHSSWMNPELTDQQVRYCVEDISNLHAVRRSQLELAEESGQGRHLTLETAILSTVARMTNNGLPINVDALEGYVHQQKIDAVGAEGEIATLVGRTVNLRSPIQLKALLGEVGIHIPSTARAVLEETILDHDDSTGLLGLVLKHRYADQRIKMYGSSWVIKNVTNGRVHARFWQAGTDTSRFSSSEPNLQQIPSRPPGSMRFVFQAEPGWKIVKCDYSQIEVRIAAHLAHDEVMLGMFQEGGADIHTMTAAAVWKLDPGSVSKAQRKIAKNMNFCLLFGGGWRTFHGYCRRNGSPLSESEAQLLVKQFFGAFPGLARTRSWAYDMANTNRSRIELQLPTGLRRVLVGREQITPTRILNTTVQGTAACGLKYGLLECKRRGLDKFLGATVHDELVACVPEEWAEDYAAELKDAMITGMGKVCADLPVEADAEVGDTWG